MNRTKNPTWPSGGYREWCGVVVTVRAGDKKVTGLIQYPFFSQYSIYNCCSQQMGHNLSLPVLIGYGEQEKTMLN